MMNKYGAIAVVGILLAGCSSNRPAIAQTEKTSNNPVVYRQGFFQVERNENGSWRWMGPKGVIWLANTHRPMVLSISGTIPIDSVSVPPALKIELNGRMLEEWTEPSDTIEREYTISPEQQGSGTNSELRIVSSQSFTPHDVDPQVSDLRQLAMMITSIAWEPQ